ncbi:hypothetical protein M3Y98_00561000 [Aphelenchoides besseyi]|nr:hypothetical protein M3Y98_00561000 [Aphelenchoides besseyi]
MPVEVVRLLIKEAKERLIRYRNSFAEDSILRATVDEDLKELEQVEMVADQVSAAKTGAEKPQQIFAACNDGISKEQLTELRRIIKEMEKKFQVINKTVFGEKTAKDADRIRFKSEQIGNLNFFACSLCATARNRHERARDQPNTH